MEIERGEIWWTDLPEPKGSMPGYRHPVLILQSDEFNDSGIDTFIGAVISSNLRLANMPGNVEISPQQSGLFYNSVVNVTQIVTANRTDLLEFVGRLSDRKLKQVEDGLRLVLSL